VAGLVKSGLEAIGVAERIPRSDPALTVGHRWEADAGDKATLTINGSVHTDFNPTDFYPYPIENVEVAPAVTNLPAESGRFAFSKTVRRLGERFPPRIEGILVQPAARRLQSRQSRAIAKPTACTRHHARPFGPGSGPALAARHARAGFLGADSQHHAVRASRNRPCQFVQQMEAPDRVKRRATYGGFLFL
jgi:hypothetical protein